MVMVNVDVKAYRQVLGADFILNALYIFDLVTSWGWWYAIGFIPVDNLNHLIMQGKQIPSQRQKKDKKKQIC